MLKIEKLVKLFDKKKIIDNINLSVYQGEFVAIMGKSGSGKSTLLKLISGLLKIDSGKLLIADEDVTKYSVDQFTQYRLKNIGMVFQDFQLIDIFDAMDNIIFPAKILNEEADSQMDHRANQLIELLRLDHVKHKNIGYLSGGEKQRVAFARSLINKPKLILADEPTGALDSENAKILIRHIKQSAKELNQTILMVTHDPYVASYADRVLFLKDGKIISEISKNDEVNQVNYEDTIHKEVSKLN